MRKFWIAAAGVLLASTADWLDHKKYHKIAVVVRVLSKLINYLS